MTILRLCAAASFLASAVRAQSFFDQRPPCVGGSCCSAQDDEFSRQFSCAMMAYLDLDPVLQLEGCAKHSTACRAMCSGFAYKNLMKQYQLCDKNHNKDTALSDWYSCFFEALISGAVNGIAFQDTETESPTAATQPYCELFSQAGCPLCVALRLRTSPCMFEPVERVCPRVCNACKCPAPFFFSYRALAFDGCPTWGKTAEWGHKCSVVCPRGYSSSGQLHCEEGLWKGTQGDPSCMSDCNGTLIALPQNGTGLQHAGKGGSCNVMKHGEKCQLSCAKGTSPSAFWICKNGVLKSTSDSGPPRCLKDCGAPKLPAYTTKWGTCTHPVLNDPQYRSSGGDDAQGQFAAVFNAFASQFRTTSNNSFNMSVNGTNITMNRLNGTTFTMNKTVNGTNITISWNGTALRNNLEDSDSAETFFGMCKALQEDNSNRPHAERWNWRRRLQVCQAADASIDERVDALRGWWRRLQASQSTVGGTGFTKDEMVGQLNTMAANLSDVGDNKTSSSKGGFSVKINELDDVWVPLSTTSGSSCSFECASPFSPTGTLQCLDGVWSKSQCAVQLRSEEDSWPEKNSHVVSPVGGIYMNFNLKVITPGAGFTPAGRKVKVCGTDGSGCPRSTDCFTSVPIEDTGRVSTDKKQLRIRLGDKALTSQIYGCEYKVSVPDGIVVAVANRSVASSNRSWNYRLVKPPPRLLVLRAESGYKDVQVTVQFDSPGTIKCLTALPGVKPAQDNFDAVKNYYVQGAADVSVSLKLEKLTEVTNYDLYCQATGVRGNQQSLVAVYDNVERFKTKTRIPYAITIRSVETSNKRVVLSVFYSSQCKVRCAAQQRPKGAFDRTQLETAVRAATAMDFFVTPKDYELQGLEPGVPTQILCWGVKVDGSNKFEQPWSDAWANALTLGTPAMTSTALGKLDVTGCQLVPPFAPKTPLYACALPAGASSANVKLSAAVPAGDYSMMKCGGAGGYVTACSKEIKVENGARATWRVEVKSQAGKSDPYIVAIMREAPLLPKEIRPTRFQADTKMNNMTVCIKGEPAKLPTSTSQIMAELLPGPWNLTVHSLHTGASKSLPTCNGTCSDCNMEVKLGVQGAGRDLTLILLVDGFPSFTLEKSMRIHFDPPEVTDVDPPRASMYKPTKLLIRGKNFGHSASVGAVVQIVKVGPAISLPPYQTFGDCPVVYLKLPRMNETGAPYAEAEFNGRYDLKKRGEYEMNLEMTMSITADEVSMLPSAILKASPDRPKDSEGRAYTVKLTRRLNNALIDRHGMCCYKELQAIRLISKDPVSGGGMLVVYRQGRRKPRLRKIGKTWSLDSRAVRNLRLSSPDGSLGRDNGWVLKWKIEYPGPRKDPPSWRRLGAQEYPSLEDRFLPMAEAWSGGMPANTKGGETDDELEDESRRLDGLEELDEDGEDELDKYDVQDEEATPEEERALLSRKMPPRQLEEKRKCKDDSGRMKTFLKNVGIEVPGFVGWIISCGTVTSWRKDLCAGLMLVCECSCKDYVNTPNEVPILGNMDVACERCGDGMLIGREVCDDGNFREGDGCSFKCLVEEGWECSKQGVKSDCKRKNGEKDPIRNLCGPTTWIDDQTLTCELVASTRTPLVLSVSLADQSTKPGDWVQYTKPTVSTLSLPGLAASGGSGRRLSRDNRVLEFIGNQELVLTGRGLPPTADMAKKTPVALLLENSLLCVDLEVTSSSEIKCFGTQPLNLDNVPEDPKLTVRVDEMSSLAVPLSKFGLPLRRPELIGLAQRVFNDTDDKELELVTREAGVSDHGTLLVTIGGMKCRIMVHTPTMVKCLIGYVPIGTWDVKMKLGNLQATSNVTATSIPTMCPVGAHRVKLETSECAECEAGRAEPSVNPEFACPNCTSSFYQNDTGMPTCKKCVNNAFSVGSKVSKEHCRCETGYYHPHPSESLARDCSACELERGFGWSTSNWSIDCKDCKARYAIMPEELQEFGSCTSKCYGIACEPCPFGTVCFGNGAWPRVLPGFWAEKIYKNAATKVDRCMPMKACLGEDGRGSMQCATGYDGTRCGVCTLGYYKEQHDCVVCPDNQWVWGASFFLFFVLVIVFGVIPAQMLFMCRLIGVEQDMPCHWRFCCFLPRRCLAYCLRRGSGSGGSRLKSCWKSCCPGPVHRFADKVLDWDKQIRAAPLLRTLSMCLNFGHTCYAFSMLQRPAVKWPGPSWELLSWTKLLTVDVEFMKPDCIVPLPFFTKWIGKYCFPFGLGVLLLVVTLYLARKLRNMLSSQGPKPNVWGAFGFTMALLIHVSLIWHLKVVLSPVDCNWCREGVKCLDENVLVECWTDDPTWMKMMVISIVDFILISGAFPIFLVCVILYAWRYDEELSGYEGKMPKQPDGKKNKLRSFTSFFVSAYRGRKEGGTLLTFGWEVVILFRKLALLLAAKFTTVDPVMGANYQLIILIVSLLGQCILAPYTKRILNNIDNLLNTLEFFVLLTACQLTMGVGEPLETFYIMVNVTSLFGGAILAMGVSLRKLLMAWEEEEYRKKRLQLGGDQTSAAGLDKPAPKVDSFASDDSETDHCPVHPDTKADTPEPVANHMEPDPVHLAAPPVKIGAPPAAPGERDEIPPRERNDTPEIVSGPPSAANTQSTAFSVV